MLLKGKKVLLKPMREEDVKLFYTWATESDATPFWYGDLYGTKIPTLEKFLKNWKPCYFSDEDPEKGRCFFIIVEDNPIGQLNYNSINKETQSVEIDILIADSKNWGKGFGSDAIKTLIKYLFDSLSVEEVWVAAIKKNPRAVKAYQKSGFEIFMPSEDITKDPEWVKKDLNEWVFLHVCV